MCRDAACTPSSCNLVFTTSSGVVAAAAMPPAIAGPTQYVEE